MSAGREFDARDNVAHDYAFAFGRYRSEPTESRLRAAYELGRRAMVLRLGLLDVAQIHHEVLLEALRTSSNDRELQDVAEAGSAFLVEVLAPFEMAHRGFEEARRAAGANEEGTD